MAKLSFNQIEDSYRMIAVDDEDFLDDDVDFPIRVEHEEIDETCYRNTYQRKELRSQRQRDEGEIVGKGSIHKHRKF